MFTRGVRANGGRRPWRVAAAAVLTASLLLTAGCSKDSDKPSWQGGGGSTSTAGTTTQEPAAPEPAKEATVAVTAPAPDATDVEAITDVKFTSEDPENTTVTVTGKDGKEVKGTLDKDEKVWRPTDAFDWGTQYTVTVTGPQADGKDNTISTSFTTMKQPSKLVRVTSHLGDGQTVGVGMPLIIKFSRAIPSKYRAEVERRMVVTATPAQEGTWHWYSSTEAHYRPKVYWKAYSKVFYKVQLKGIEMGDGWYGRSNLTVDLKIGRSFVMNVSNKTKKMTVTQDGKVVNTIPVSLGAKKTPSSSGTMVVMEKLKKTVFDTTDTDGAAGYRTPIDFAQRITWSGQFIHAAPWSEGVQGRSNVSHGCVNVSMKMGEWLFSRTMLGDPITVSGTEEKLKNGNGWTDWNMSWEQYKQGSALH